LGGFGADHWLATEIDSFRPKEVKKFNAGDHSTKALLIIRLATKKPMLLVQVLRVVHIAAHEATVFCCSA
jgi:hypothetical protein